MKGARHLQQEGQPLLSSFSLVDGTVRIWAVLDLQPAQMACPSMHCQILIGGRISSKQIGHSNSVFHSAVLIEVEVGGTDPTGMSSEEPLSEASILLSSSDSWLSPYLSGNGSNDKLRVVVVLLLDIVLFLLGLSLNLLQLLVKIRQTFFLL